MLLSASVKINKKDTVLETRNSETWLGLGIAPEIISWPVSQSRSGCTSD